MEINDQIGERSKINNYYLLLFFFEVASSQKIELPFLLMISTSGETYSNDSLVRN